MIAISELYFSTKYRPLRPHAPFGRTHSPRALRAPLTQSHSCAGIGIWGQNGLSGDHRARHVPGISSTKTRERAIFVSDDGHAFVVFAPPLSAETTI